MPAKQNEVVENWITRGVDAIAVAVENRGGDLDRAAQGARRAASRCSPGTRTPSPTRATSSSIRPRRKASATRSTDEAARLLGGKGEFAIITGALSAANQNEWIAFIRKRLAEKYPRPEARRRSGRATTTATRRSPRRRRSCKVHPAVKLIMAISAPAVPGAAEAVRQAGRTDVKVIGLSLPNINKPYVHGGIVQTVVLWNTRDLGYLTVYAAAMRCRGKLSAGVAIAAGRPARRDQHPRDRDHPRAAAALQQGQHRSLRFLVTATNGGAA